MSNKKVLNIGGGNKNIPIPKHYDGWDHLLLDIQEGEGVDVVCDAALMKDKLEKGTYDAVYMSHNLEHHYRHNLPKIFDGIKHVLKPDGFVEITVPDMNYVFKQVALNGKDIEDIAYESACGPIRFVDMVYGLSVLIDEKNNFMAHKNGFTAKSLGSLLWTMEFEHVFIGHSDSTRSLLAFAFMERPNADLMEKLRIVDRVI